MTRLALAGLLLAACHAEPSPDAVLRRYTQLLREGHVEAAYQLTSARYRAHHDVASFAAQGAHRPLVEGRVVDHDVVLTLDGADGPIELVGRDAAHLSLTRDPVDAYPRDTPEACLRSFARAVTRDQRDVLKRLLSPALATGLREDTLPKPILDAAAQVTRHLAQVNGESPPVVQLGSDAHARLLLGEGVAITLEEQAAGWQISELP